MIKAVYKTLYGYYGYRKENYALLNPEHPGRCYVSRIDVQTGESYPAHRFRPAGVHFIC